MGQIEEKRSARMAKSVTGAQKSSSSGTKATKTNKIKTQTPSTLQQTLSDPKIQGAVLVGLLAVLVLALWYGFTHGCLGRRRRRRASCNSCGY